MDKDILEKGCMGFALIVIVCVFISWSNARDGEIMEGAKAYEACIKMQYHTTPEVYREKNGSYPECNV